MRSIIFIYVLNTLYTIAFNFSQEYHDFYLTFFSIIAILCSIFVITNKNPIVSILFLICLFVLVSGYLLLLGMNFIGISYLLVYIGAVSILFLFILMLINIRISEIQSETSNSLPLAIIISISFYIALYELIPSHSRSLFNKNFEWENSILSHIFSSTSLSNQDTNYVVSAQWDTNLMEVLHITSIGNILYTNYFVWLILTSIILLLAMVGTIIITIKQ